MKAIPALAVLLTVAATLAGAAETIPTRPGVAILRPPAQGIRASGVAAGSRALSATSSADPRVHVTATPDATEFGAVTFTLSVSNEGDTILPGPIVVAFESSAAFAAASVNGNGWNCSLTDQTCEWPAPLGPGSSTGSAGFDLTADPPYDGAGSCDRSPCLFLRGAVSGHPGSAGGGFTAITVGGHAPPTARDDIAYMPATPVTISIVPLDNDSYETPAGIDVTVPPAHGVATVNPSGMNVEYTPDATFTGTDSLRYTIADFAGATATATVNIGPLPGGIAFRTALVDIGHVAIGRIAMRLAPIDNTTGALLQGTATVEPVDPADIPGILAGTGYDPALAVYDPTVFRPQDGQFVSVEPNGFATLDAMVRPTGPLGTVYVARVRITVSPYLNPQVSVSAEIVIAARADDGTHTPVHARDDAQTLPADTPTVVFPLANDDGMGGGVITMSGWSIVDPFDGTFTFELGTLENVETNFPFLGLRVTPFPGASGTGTFYYAMSELIDGTFDRYDYAPFTVTIGTLPPPPIAVASGSATICAGGSAGLTGSGGVSCTWSPATGLSSATSCMPTASPLSTTTYTLTVRDIHNQPSTNNPTVTVTVNPLPVAVAGGSTTITLGQSAPLSGSGGASCAWSPATGLNNAASCTPTATPAVTTSYALVVTAAGCASVNPASATITVVPPQTLRPDLVDAVLIPLTARRNQTIQMVVGTLNIGAGNAAASTTRFYLSRNTELDASDVSIGQLHMPPLAAGGVRVDTANGVIPGNAAGNYYVIAVADDGHVIAETNETNNAGPSPWRIRIQ